MDNGSRQYRYQTADLHKTTINGIMKRYQGFGDVSAKRKEKFRVRRKTNNRDDQSLVDLSRKDTRKSAVDLARELTDSGVHVSAMTVRRVVGSQKQEDLRENSSTNNCCRRL